VFWGGREGVETDAAKNPVEGLKRFARRLNFLCEYSIDRGLTITGLPWKPSPTSRRGDIYLPTTGAMLGFIATLTTPEMVGVTLKWPTSTWPAELPPRRGPGLGCRQAVSR